MKNRSHRYDTNRPKTTYGHKYSKYKKCFSMMMLIYYFMKKLNNTEAELKKNVTYKKSVYFKPFSNVNMKFNET